MPPTQLPLPEPSNEKDGTVNLGGSRSTRAPVVLARALQLQMPHGTREELGICCIPRAIAHRFGLWIHRARSPSSSSSSAPRELVQAGVSWEQPRRPPASQTNSPSCFICNNNNNWTAHTLCEDLTRPGTRPQRGGGDSRRLERAALPGARVQFCFYLLLTMVSDGATFSVPRPWNH